jgi:tetratricopeptide (TPR) repeat protein
MRGGWVAVGIALAVVGASAQTTTEPLTGATTATLRTKPEFFELASEQRITTAPKTSTIVGESSATLGTVTVDLGATAPLAFGAGTIAVTTSTELIGETEKGAGLPMAVDRSTTASLLRQLEDLERRNLYAEAYLLACQLVRENPDAEFAYDAAIRTAIVLSHANPDQMESDLEFFFHEAKRVAPLPGRYVLLQAHYYDRMGKVEKLRKLVSDYEKRHAADPDYWVTLVRLFAMSGEKQRSRELLERAVQQSQDVFPLVLLGARMYRELGLPDKARSTLLAAVDQNYGPWQMRALLLEFLKLPAFVPADVAQMLRGALANEVRYTVARGLADAVIESALEHRAFFAFQRFLDERLSKKTASDMEMWLGALLAMRAGEDDRAYEILTADPAKATPVISYERALALAQREKHEEARNILAVLVAEQPNETPFRLALAKEQVATTQPADALDTLSPIVFEQLTSEERESYNETAMAAAVMTGDPQRIIGLWLDLIPATTFAELQAMGDIVVRALEHDPHPDRVEAAVAQAVRDPNNWQLHALYARLCGRRGDHRAEIENYRAYLDHAADDTQMLRFTAQLALQYAMKPLHVEAVSDRPTSATVRLLDNWLMEQSIDFYKRLIALQPMVTDNYAALMRVYQFRGEVEAAKKVAAELAARDPASPELLASAAEILDENGFLPEALHYYERALHADPADYAVWLKYAQALQAAGKHAQAELIYKRILEEGYGGKPYNQPALLANLLKLATATHETSGLSAYLCSLRGRQIPGKAEFLLSAAKLLLQVGAADEALATVEQFQKEFPNHPLLEESYQLTGQIWFSRGNVDKAVAVFRSIEQKFPSSRAAITAGFNAAVALASAGRIDEAVESYRRLAKQYARDDHALGALYEAAVLVYRARKDTEQTKKLLEEFLATDCQDFALRRNARGALEALRAGKEPFENASETMSK